MFFIMGIDPRQKQLQYNGTMFICDRCGQYGRYEVFMTYMCFSLFFIPLIKWNKRYIVRTTCCSGQYELDSAIGQEIARGDNVEIRPEHLIPLDNRTQQRYKRCSKCGFATTEDFAYCPSCGNPLE